MSDVGIVDTGVGRLNEVLISSCRVEYPVAMKLQDGIDDDEEAEGDDDQGGEGHQEAEKVGPRDPVQTTVRTSNTMNPELVHVISYYLAISETWKKGLFTAADCN